MVTGLAAAVSGLLACALMTGAGLGLLAYRFYRDPERVPPARGRRSTKHGTKYTLDELTKTPIQDDDALAIGIALNFLDVHVNRAPIGGQVLALKHSRFGSLRLPEMVFENERTTLVIRHRVSEVAVVLIASRLVRRIVTYVREG